MDIFAKLEKDYLQAFKEKNELAVLVLRGLKTAFTNAEIAKSRQALTEPEIIKLLRTEIKRRKEAAELYLKGNRPELAQKENQEIGIISRYLPAEISEDDIRKKIREIVEKTGASSPADIGKVTGAAMKEFAGAADGGMVSRIVKEELSK